MSNSGFVMTGHLALNFVKFSQNFKLHGQHSTFQQCVHNVHSVPQSHVLLDPKCVRKQEMDQGTQGMPRLFITDSLVFAT